MSRRLFSQELSFDFRFDMIFLPSDHCECKILEKSKERYHQRQVFEGLDWEDFGLWWTFHATEIIIAFRAKFLHKSEITYVITN